MFRPIWTHINTHKHVYGLLVLHFLNYPAITALLLFIVLTYDDNML